MKLALILLLGIVLAAAVAQSWSQETEPADTAMTQAARADSEHVARAVFTTAIRDREPIDKVENLATDVDSVFFFTEIVDMQGSTIVHRWMHGGEKMAEVSFEIGGPRWRVFSKKTLIPAWTGAWTVEVLDGSGATLRTESFEYKQPD